jgi:hypothetical protein
MDKQKQKQQQPEAPRNPLIEQFYKSLSVPERKAHEIAARPGSMGGLGSSYIVERTPSFIKWLQLQQTK